MPDQRPDPVQPADDAARALARGLLAGATHAALAWTDPATGTPGISRIAFGLGPDGCPLTLVSTLAAHRGAPAAHPAGAVMVGEPGGKGDPLTHPRLTLRATARFVARDAPERAGFRAAWLRHHPRAGLYVDYADFHFVRFEVAGGHFNAGFGKAYALSANDLMVD